MARLMTKSAFTVGLLVLLMSVPAFGASINKNISIEDGGRSNGASSVNGNISVGEEAEVSGGLRTVNGKIRVGRGASITTAKTVNGSIHVGGNVAAEDLTTVNGAVTVGTTSSVDGDVTAVNGRITLEQGAFVSRNIENVNGRVEFRAAEAGGDLTTVTGDVNFSGGSVLKGDLIVEKPGNWGWKSNSNKRKPRIVIGPDSRVLGTIVLEREVDLFISETAEVGGVSGVMGLDDAVRFSGDSP